MTPCPSCGQYAGHHPSCDNHPGEPDACEYCEGAGSISYNPNLNPNAFPASATIQCKHCNGTGRIIPPEPDFAGILADRAQRQEDGLVEP